MAKEAVFTMKFEPVPRGAFTAAAKAVDRPASRVVREMPRDFVPQDRDDLEFLQPKAERPRQSIKDGRWSSNEEVHAKTTVRRAELQRRIYGIHPRRWDGRPTRGMTATP